MYHTNDIKYEQDLGFITQMMHRKCTHSDDVHKTTDDVRETAYTLWWYERHRDLNVQKPSAYKAISHDAQNNTYI